MGFICIYILVGSPLIRKNDLIKLAKKHSDCAFLAFTNATLVDEDFSLELGDIGNLGLAISIEGNEKETDARRGHGTYGKIMKAMTLLQKYGVMFGFSTCYHKYNTDSVGSEEYIDKMIQKGCMFGWYFTYIPIGKNAVVDLMATPAQREYMFHSVRKARKNKPIFILDFWNDGDFVDGCIAGGKNYLHINAKGDVEPCAFIHYSNVNINETSLLEALKSPIFRQYRSHQPFNDNHLRPCPLLDNPEKLREMVHNAKARPTQPIDEESVEDLTSKTEEAAKRWAPVAEKLWGDLKNESENSRQRDSCS
ncbi:MAG: radical SAM protein [Synergistaceae bacterium]|nr:radical SAM protein [Synergistaceae bacterium]